MDIEFSNIRSSRPEILIRCLNNNDAKSICDNLGDKEIVRYTIQIPYPYHLSDARQFIKYSTKARKTKNAFVFGIELKETKKIIGMVSISKIDRKNKNCELGYWLGKKYWRKGIASAAIKMILDYTFNKLKMHRVYARVFASNTASLRVLEKNNFLLEGVLFETHWRFSQWHNMFLYGILKDDFKK
jgi:RimJ/RimL family protein N-acetyltransferase